MVLPTLTVSTTFLSGDLTVYLAPYAEVMNRNINREPVIRKMFLMDPPNCIYLELISFIACSAEFFKISR